MQYEYDLASGKVNFISYQDGANDRFYYQYKYDRDIRLVEALTGTEADILPQGSELLNEKTNVTYQYYLHGPLARMELGHDKVQGVDYAYTLQGWLKGINGHKLNATQEMGNDGVANTDRATIARDVMAYTLGYYQGDYQPIGTGSATAFPMQFTTQPADITGHDLFNGNISHTTVALSKFRSGDPVGYSYRYDQLNRLKQMRRHGLAANTTTWNSSSISDKFKESIVYDGNGNIKTYLRNGANETGMPLAMDNLTYVYNTAIDPVSGNPYLVNNRLTQVTDQVASGNYSQALNGTEDLDGQSANNYHYDKIGNLVKDVKENIDRIEWTVYGKIKKITKSNSDIIAYTYDAAGNRASKSVTLSGVTTTTWYVRDAQGNSLALYSDKQGGQSGMWWKEQSLYGSSRLGIWAPEINISSVNGTSQWNVAGKTVYELSNHLGNVMATITDKKIGHDPGNGIIDYYNADVTSATDYYPFGMQMPGRNWSSSTYRYGFNGKENDNEVKGVGNQQDYGMRIYDPRIGRFLSVDPITKKYPMLTPYQFASNTPIVAVDLDGLEGFITMPNEQGTVLTNTTADVIKTAIFKSTFTHSLPKKFIDLYANGQGTPYRLTPREAEALNVAKTGFHGIAPNDIIKANDFISSLSPGETKNIPEGYSITGAAMNAGTLGRFQIKLRGEVTKYEDGDFSFRGQMQYADVYDFKTSETKEGDVERSDWGDLQTQFADKNLNGKGFEVTSEWIDIEQIRSNYFNYFDGKSEKVIMNKVADNDKIVSEIKKANSETKK